MPIQLSARSLGLLASCLDPPFVSLCISVSRPTFAMATAGEAAPATAPPAPEDFPSTYLAIRFLPLVTGSHVEVCSVLQLQCVFRFQSVVRMTQHPGCQFCGFWTTSPSPMSQTCSGKWWPLLPWAFGSKMEPRGCTCLLCVNAFSPARVKGMSHES